MIILIDNYDSFSYNLYQMLGEMDPEIEVIRNDAATAEEILEKEPKAIILSPGPGRPSEAGICEEIVKICAGRIPILGVCLGHQAICEAFGGMIVHAKELMHGKQSEARLSRWSLLFKGLPEKIKVARYHSLAVRPDTLPRAIRVSAVAEDGEIMAVEHERAPIYGLQFHPESIMTEEGKTILKNFLAIADSFKKPAKDKATVKEKAVVKDRDVVKDKNLVKDRADIKDRSAVRDKAAVKEETVVNDKPVKKEVQPFKPPVIKREAAVKAVLAEAVRKLVNRENLSREMAEQSMDELLSGKAEGALIASFLTALRAKTVTDEELAACAAGLRKHTVRPECSGEVIDVGGTGADAAYTFNIWVAASVILAAAGLKVAEHGSRATPLRCSAADCLERLGAKISDCPEKMPGILDKTGLGFLNAPYYQPDMKYVYPVIKELPFSTVFDLLEPFTNPAFPAKQLLGVYREDLVEPMARILGSLGVKRAMTVFGQDGLDEISLCAPTTICELKDGQFTTYMIRPEDFGFQRSARSELEGAKPEASAQKIKAILAGEKGAGRDAVLLNTGAALHMAKEISIEDGIREAAELIDNGRAKAKMEEFIQAVNGGAKG